MKFSISLPHRKFVNRLLSGATAKDAYLHAFPKASPSTARTNGPRLRRRPHIQAELQALRDKADTLPGSDFLTYVETRRYFARVVRASAATLPDDSDLWNVKKSAKGSLHLRFPDKLRTLMQDSKLAGFIPAKAPRKASPQDKELLELLQRIRAADSIPVASGDSSPVSPSDSISSPPPIAQSAPVHSVASLS